MYRSPSINLCTLTALIWANVSWSLHNGVNIYIKSYFIIVLVTIYFKQVLTNSVHKGCHYIRDPDTLCILTKSTYLRLLLLRSAGRAKKIGVEEEGSRLRKRWLSIFCLLSDELYFLLNFCSSLGLNACTLHLTIDSLST